MYMQLPFPMDSLYADPERKVKYCTHYSSPFLEFPFLSILIKCWKIISSISGIWCSGFILWSWAYIFQSSQCKLLSQLLRNYISYPFERCLLNWCMILHVMYDRQRCSQDLTKWRKLWKTIPSKPLQMMHAVYYNRYENLYKHSSNIYVSALYQFAAPSGSNCNLFFY